MIDPSEVPDELLNDHFYKEASVAERDDDGMTFVWENGLTVSIAQRRRGWEVGMEIVVNGAFRYWPIEPTTEVRGFWSYIAEWIFWKNLGTDDTEEAKRLVNEVAEEAEVPQKIEVRTLQDQEVESVDDWTPDPELIAILGQTGYGLVTSEDQCVWEGEIPDDGVADLSGFYPLVEMDGTARVALAAIKGEGE